MNKLIITLFICLVQISLLNAKPIKTQAPIDNVTVFLDGAEISRTTQINLTSGINEVVVENLSSSIIDNSIRVQLGDELSLLSLTVQYDYLFDKTLSPELNAYKDSIEQIEEKMQRITNQLIAFDKESEMLKSNHSLASDNTTFSVQKLNEAANFFRERYTNINNSISKLKMDYNELEAKLKRLEKQFNTISDDATYTRKKFILLIKSSQNKSFPIGLKYLVRNAGWTPHYDIKAINTAQPLELIYNAKVYNETDIEWSNIPLTLSAADPQQEASKPELKRWELNYSRSSKFKSYRANSGYINQAKMDSINGGIMVAVENLNAEFPIKESVSIPSGSAPYFIQISKHNLPASYKHYCAPKEEASAFLLARVSDWEDLDLIAGKANIYFNGTFIGESFINPAEVNDTLDVSLGRDKNIIIKRIKKKELSSKQLIGPNKKETYVYEIAVKNNSEGSINLELADQIPVSLDSEIVVEKLSSNGAFFNELEGLLTWELQLQPKQSKTIEFSFSIKYPKNKPLKSGRPMMRSLRYF